jgi:hypothetical protein
MWQAWASSVVRKLGIYIFPYIVSKFNSVIFINSFSMSKQKEKKKKKKTNFSSLEVAKLINIFHTPSQVKVINNTVIYKIDVRLVSA